MTEPSNILDTVVREVADVLSPLIRVADSTDPLRTLRFLLRGAGWRITSEVDPQPIIDAIDAVVDAVAAALDGVDPDDLAAFLVALDAVRQLVIAIEGLIDVIAAGGPRPPTPDELAVFGEDLLHLLATGWIARKAILGDVALFLGLLEVVDADAASVGGWLERRPTRVLRVRPAVFTDLIADPLGYLRDRIAPNEWAASADAAATNVILATQLDPLMRRIGGRWQLHADALSDPTDGIAAGRIGEVEVELPIADEAGRARFGFEYAVYSAVDRNGAGVVGPAVELAPFGGYSHTFDQGSWAVTLALALSLGGVDVGDSPPLLRFSGAGVDAVPGLDARFDVGAHLDLTRIVGGKGTRIELGALDVGTFVSISDDEFDAGVSIVASGSKIVLSAADLGAAVAAVAQFENTLEFDLGLQWSKSAGVTIAGSASLEIEFTEGVDIGGIVTLSGLRIKLELADTISLNALTDVGIRLGPVAMTFDDLGLALELSFPPGGGNLGAADLSIAIQPPKGIGIRVDASVVVGGGFLFLDPENGEYAGVLELSFPALSLSLKAIGIFTTKLPGGAEGYALLLLVFAEFPSVQLGYGFTLNGVGGILGIQHGVSIDALQEGMRSGVLDSVLFPDDPVARAPELLDDLRAVFPISPGSLTFGPALQIGWGAGILTVSLGLVLQFDDVIGPGAGDPSIARIVLLGQLKVVLPPVDDAPEVVKLLVDILGYYDFDEQELGIDARLRDSHLIGLPLTGSLVLRARFGSDPTFILAIGGFHPRFTDLPPGLPPQDRLGVQLRYGVLTVQILSYTAITSNSFQFGAEASIVAEAASFRVEAYVGFDALFLFQPVLHFTFDFRVGAAISWKDWDLAAVRVAGTLTGPGRWEISGSASFKVLCFEVSIDFREAWGSVPAAPLQEAAVLPRIVDALEAADAWSAQLPGGLALVTLRQDAADSARTVVHPLGSLEGRQKVTPLGVTVTKVGAARPTDGNRFEIGEVRVGDQVVTTTRSQEHFPRGDYFELSEDEQLTAPSFERFDAGVRIGSNAFSGPRAVAFDPVYETAYIDSPDVYEFVRIDGQFLLAHAAIGAVARAPSTQLARALDGEQLGIAVVAASHLVAGQNDHEELASGLTFTLAKQLASDTAVPAIVMEFAEAKP